MLCIYFVGIYWGKSGWRYSVIFTKESQKIQSFVMVRSPVNLSLESLRWEVWWCLMRDPSLRVCLAFCRKSCLNLRNLFPVFSYWTGLRPTVRMQQEVGESRRKGRTDVWQKSFAIREQTCRTWSGAKCTFISPFCCCQQWQRTFYREFHVLTLSFSVWVRFQACFCCSTRSDNLLLLSATLLSWMAKVFVMYTNIPALQMTHNGFNITQHVRNYFF